MRRHWHWIPLVAIIAAACVVWVWPRNEVEDPYAYLHALHPRETTRWASRYSFVGSARGPEKFLRSFSFAVPFDKVAPSVVEHEAKERMAGRVSKRLYLTYAVSRGPAPDGILCELTVEEDPGWFATQVHRVKAFLHLE